MLVKGERSLEPRLLTSIGGLNNTLTANTFCVHDGKIPLSLYRATLKDAVEDNSKRPNGDDNYATVEDIDEDFLDGDSE